MNSCPIIIQKSELSRSLLCMTLNLPLESILSPNGHDSVFSFLTSRSSFLGVKLTNFRPRLFVTGQSLSIREFLIINFDKVSPNDFIN